MAGIFPKRLTAAVLLLAGAALSQAREPQDVALTIGPGWCVVKEERTLALRAGRHEILLHNIPGEADLSSLTVRSRRLPVKLLSWSWVDASAGGVGTADPNTERLSSGDVSWSPSLEKTEEQEAGRYLRSVRCLLDSPVSGDRTLELSYLVRGLRWSARYQLLVRGWDEAVDRALSVDIDGTVRILNQTSLSFDQASVRLVGLGGTADGKSDPPGFLMLDPESPLADLWKDKPQAHRTEYSYTLPGPVGLMARAEQVVTFLRADRVRGGRRYRMTSDRIPLSSGILLVPLPHEITFANHEEAGLGRELPPGSVDIFPGSMRQYMMPGATIPHTPPDTLIRIDMGLSSDVSGGRRLLRRRWMSEDVYEETYELTVRNARQGPVEIEVVEKPPAARSWDLISANAPLTEKSGSLHFNVQVDGKNERRISYRIRVERPRI